MILTKELAIENVGKYIDQEHRRFGYFPKKIILIDGEPALKDDVGVCGKVLEDKFNVTHFDYMAENLTELSEMRECKQFYNSTGVTNENL